MAKLNWTAEAQRWLEEIRDYISRDSPAAAIKVVQGIYNKAQLLRDFPEIGYKYRVEPDGDIRILLYGHYRIAYLIKSQGEIDILGVFHGAFDMDRHIRRY